VFILVHIIISIIINIETAAIGILKVLRIAFPMFFVQRLFLIQDVCTGILTIQIPYAELGNPIWNCLRRIVLGVFGGSWSPAFLSII